MDNSAAAATIRGVDIAKIMTSSGPIVNAVILRCPSLSKETEEDSKLAAVPTAATTTTEKKNGNDDTSSSDTVTVVATATAIRPKRVVITDLIEEVKIDTTPSKSKIAEVLGGPFTFLGQYEDEGIVLMVRKIPDDLEIVLEDIYNNEEEGEEEVDDDDENNNKNSSNKSTPNKPSFSFPEQLSKNFNVKALKAVCIQREIVTEGMIEKSDLIKAILDYQSHLPPYNTHQLQPPLHKACVRGDILILKVAETKEELDGDSDEEENNNDASKEGKDIDEGNETEKNNYVDDNKNQNNEKTTTKVSKIKINNQVETKPKKVKTDEIKKDKVEDEDKDDDETKTKTVIVPTNDEFFLDYSKSEYVTFASRLDIPEHEMETPEDDDDDEEEDAATVAATVAAAAADTDEVEEGRDGNEEGFIIEEGGDDEEIDETDKSAMFNLVMNEVLRQYREENGRGPNTKELLELRANIAKELGVEIAEEIDGDWDKRANANSVPSAKKIAFDPEKDTVKEYIPDANEYLSDNGKDIISRSLMGDYDEDEDDEDYAEEPPTKRLKTSEEDEK